MTRGASGTTHPTRLPERRNDLPERPNDLPPSAGPEVYRTARPTHRRPLMVHRRCDDARRGTFLILSASRVARVIEGSRVKRILRLRFADDTQKRLDISRPEKNIRPPVAAVQDVIKSSIDDRSRDAWPASKDTVIMLNRK